MIYWIEWQFWSWKSSLATYIAKKQAINTAKAIAKQVVWWKSIILSNIKFDEFKFKNYFYFEDDKFLEVLRTANFLNDLEREVYHTKRDWSSLVKRHRDKFTKFYIFFDESTALQNNLQAVKDLRTKDHSQEEYIMQNRKNFENIYIIWADWNQNEKSLRRHVEWWYRIKPLWFWLSKLPFLCDIWIIERHKKDEEWNIAMDKYVWKDEKGDYVAKQKPIQENIDWFYKPWVWDLYDDLHKNIKDPNKNEINLDHLHKFISWNTILEEKVSLILWKI
jgi:hypothetical protein